MSEGAATTLPLKARGERPYFFDEPAVDKLLAMLLALTGELSVQSERFDSLLRVLESKGVLSAAEVDAYEPTPSVMKLREERRESLLETVMHVVLLEVEEMERAQHGG